MENEVFGRIAIMTDIHEKIGKSGFISKAMMYDSIKFRCEVSFTVFNREIYVFDWGDHLPISGGAKKMKSLLTPDDLRSKLYPDLLQILFYFVLLLLLKLIFLV